MSDAAALQRVVTRKELEVHFGGAPGSWTSIDGVVYDITDWMKSHPGGTVIRLAAGRDATTLIESYHAADSTKKVMAALKARCPVIGRLEGARPPADKRFFETVRARVDAMLKEKGLPRANPWLTLFEWSITVILYVFFWYCVSKYAAWWAILGMGIGLGRIGFIMHSGNHMAMARTEWGNSLGGWGMDLLGGASLVWSFEHQVAHHMDPNVLHKDNDCQIGKPVFRFHPGIPRHWWHRVQGVLTLMGMTFGMAKWFFTDIFHMWDQQVGSVRFYVGLRDWAWTLWWKGLWVYTAVYIPYHMHGAGQTAFQVLAYLAVASHYLENIFIVNHIQHDLVPPADSHWASMQVLATSNWCSGGTWANFISGGLNHQIEHHIFPTYSIYLYPLMSPIVKQTCEEFGLPYRNYPSFFHAWWAMFSYLTALGTPQYDHQIEHASPEKERLSPKSAQSAVERAHQPFANANGNGHTNGRTSSNGSGKKKAKAT